MTTGSYTGYNKSTIDDLFSTILSTCGASSMSTFEIIDEIRMDNWRKMMQLIKDKNKEHVKIEKFEKTINHFNNDNNNKIILLQRKRGERGK